jgi:hypothetical protein
MPRMRHNTRAAARLGTGGRGRIGRVPRQRGRQGRLGCLFPASGLRAQVRAGIRLARSTPGLSVYLGGGLAVWLLSHALVGHGLAASPLGAMAVEAVRLLGLALVAALYFRRSGHLAQGRADLRRLRRLLAERTPWQEEPSPSRRQLFRLLRWSLRVHR